MSYASGMYTLLHLATLTLTVFALSRIFSSVKIRSVGSAVVVAIVFSLLNFFLGWLIRVALFLPAILTLGLLFLVLPFIVNTILLWLTDKLDALCSRSTRWAGSLASAAVTHAGERVLSHRASRAPDGRLSEPPRRSLDLRRKTV